MEYNTTRMAEEYNELLCQAINTIVAASLNELKFDKTIVCTITDISERKNGKYIATDGSITFEAFSDYTNYLKGDQVQVTIPNGDWSAQKTIIGRHSSDTENNPIVHILSTDSVANLTGNIIESKYGLEFGITANSDTKLLQVCMFDNLAYDTEVHNTLCVKADFKTVLSNYNLQSGVYGLFIRLYTNNEGPVLTFNLSSDKDMFGRVYNFQDWVTQEQKFKFSSSIGVITKIEVFLAQDKNFIHKNDSGEEVQIEPTLTPNIFVRHLNIFLGVDMSTIVDNTVKIYTNDSSKYGKENNTKTIKLIWYNKGEGNKFLSFNDGSFNEAAKSPSETSNEENYYWIEWFADTKEGYLQYLGEEFDKATQINYTFSDLPMTEVKAIVWLNGVSHESKLQFFNELGDVAGKFDVEYSFTELLGDYKEPNKEVENDGWYDPNDELPEDKTLNDAIWMATRSSDDGGENWTQWVVTRIRGNDGKDGDSPYLIELTNDSATVGVDVNGNPIGLEEATATSVKVYRGSQDITNNCIYTWSAENGKVLVKESQKAALTSISADTAKLTVKVQQKIEEKTIDIGSKSMTVSKIPSTATYKLVATPQVINMTTSLRDITFKVIKYTKEQSIEFSEPSEDLQIVLSTEDAASEVTITGFLAEVKDDFNGATFELQAKKPDTTDDWFTWDRETVSVQRGSQYTSTIFKRTAIDALPPVAPDDETVSYFNPLPAGWFDGIPADGGPLIWMSSAVFENIAGFTPTWSTPVLAMDVEGKFDIQYSDLENPSGDPGGTGWYSPEGVQTIYNAIWMATRSRAEGGSWSAWTITRIKGEDGVSPYTIDLSNDSATIGTDSEGNYSVDVLKEVSKTTVTVYLGEKLLQTGLSYVWSVTDGDKLNNYNTNEVYFTQLTNDTGSATVRVESDGSIIGTKTFTISKNKQGDKGADAVSYQLVASPTSWNGTQNPNGITVNFTVIKMQGTNREELNSGYVIKVGDEAQGALSSYKITDTTTFTLLIDDDIWDTATVDKVVDGSKGEKGDQGEDGPQGITGTKTEAVRIYYGTNQSEIPDLATNQTPSTDSTSLGAWTLQPLSATEDARYVFTSTGVKTTTYNASNIAQTPTYSSWTTPELFKAYNTNGIDQQNYATYLRITNFKTDDGLYYTEIDGVQKLAINATYIKTGTFVVEEGNTTIFSAGWSKNANGQITPSVSMAGWMVDSEKISKNLGANNQMVLSSVGVLIEENPISGSDDSVDEFVIAAGTKFGVTNTGKLYANEANITGVITATGGKIGDWLIDGSLLKSTNGILTLNGQNGSISSSLSGNSFLLSGGKLTVKNADIQGHIEADTGNIGQLKIEDGALYGSIIYYQPISDPIAFRITVSDQPAGQYKVDKYNNHTWHNYIYAVVSGEKINATNVDSNNVEFYFVKEYPTTDGQYAFVEANYGANLSSYTVPSGANYLIINQPKTYSTNNGAPIVTNASTTDYTFSLTANGLKCTTGEVGGWKITKNAIESDTTTLWANGTIQCRNGGAIVFGKTYLDCSLSGGDQGVLTYLGTTFDCSAYLCANAIYVPNPNESEAAKYGRNYIKLIFNGAAEEGVVTGSVTWEKVSNIGDAGTNESNE